MANWYVYSGAAGAGTGADWANAKTTLAAAFSAGAAGDTFYVADDHAETQATDMTLTSPGTAASPCRVLCVLRSGGSVPPVSADLRTTAAVESTSSGAVAIRFSGFAYYYGVTFKAGTAATGSALRLDGSGSNFWLRFENCSLQVNGTGTSGAITVGNPGNQSSGLVEWADVTVQFAAALQLLSLNGPLVWRGGSLAGATVPTTLFASSSGSGGSGLARVVGVDLSALDSGHNLVDASKNKYYEVFLENCKLGASVSVMTGTNPGQGGARARVVNCDSADTNYRYHLQDYRGTITQETTVVRSGGASDGTTAVSRKVVSSAGTQFYAPLKSDWSVFWNETTGSAITATVEVVTDGVTLTDAEAWLEVEYLGTSGFPIASRDDDSAGDVLTSGTNQASSSASWTTTGLSSPVKQQFSVTFTPQEKGPVRCRVCLAKASTTLYYCPKVDVT